MLSNIPVPQPKVNRLLGSLPETDLERLLDRVEMVGMGVREPLFDIGRPIEHVYFPLNGVHSILSRVDENSYVEVATVGNEGMIGLPVFLGSSISQNVCFSQVPGYSLRLETGAFQEVVHKDPTLQQLLYRYTQALFNQVAQGSACNRHHETTQRLARWLLMTQDRAGSATFPMTQEFIALMLGVRRATASDAEQALQEAGLIQYQRGILTVLNRQGLENASCVCYRIITDDLNRLIPQNPQGKP